MQQSADSKQLQQDYVPLEYLLGSKAKYYLSPQRSSFGIPKNGKNFHFALSKVLNQRQREEKARKYLEEYVEAPGTELSLFPETSATSSIRLLKSPCDSKPQLLVGCFDGFSLSSDSLSNVGTHKPMVEPRSSHINPFEDLQPVNVEDEVRQEKKETSGLSVQGDHPYLITDRKMDKEEKFALQRQKQKARAQMVQNMRARLAAQQENTRKIMKNVLPGTCAALRSQDDSLVERRNAAVDQKHCTIAHVRHEVEVQKEHLQVEIQSVHEAKIKYTKEVRDSIIEKKMRAKERKLFLEMQHKQRLEFLRKNKAGNASFKTAVKVDIEQVEDTNHREDEKLMCDIPDVNQCSFVALVKNVPKMYSGGFGMKKPKDHENNRDIKEQFTSSDSISTNDLSLDTKSVKSVQLGPRNSNSSIKK